MFLDGQQSKITKEGSEPAVCRIAFFVCGELEGRNPEGMKKAWVRLSVVVPGRLSFQRSKVGSAF